MAVSRLFACDSCEAGEALLTFAETWGVDSSESAPRAYSGYGKVRGLFSQLWCPGCRVTRPYLLLHLQPPADHAVVAYAEAQRQGLTGYETGPCTTCGEILLTTAETGCPVCEKGVLHMIGEWEDAV